MLKISQSAYDRLNELLADRPDDVAVRIVFRRGRVRLRPGRQQEGDQVVQHQGRAVLLLDEDVASRLNQRNIDVRSTVNGPRLRLLPLPEAGE